MKRQLLKSILLLCALVVGSSNVWADTTVAVDDVLWTEPFKGTNTSTTFSETSSWGDYTNPTTFVAADAGSLSYSSSNAMVSSTSSTNMTSAHVWLNKSVDGYIQVNGIKLYNASKVKVSWSQATSGSSTTVYYQFDGSGEFKELSTCSGPNANFESDELSVSNHTTIALKFMHPSSNAKNTRIDNLKLTVTEIAAAEGTTTAPTISGETPFINTTTVTITNDASADGAAIYYTLNGDDPTTTTSATCFAYTAPFSIDATTTVKAIAKHADDTNASSVVNKTFTKIVPMSVADARAAIDAGTGTTGVYVRGIVCEGGSSLSSGAMNYWISDDGTETDKFEIYRGKGIDGASFTNESDIQVGDVVVVYGNITKYNSTYEFSANSQIFSLTRTPKYAFNYVASPVAGGTIEVLDENADDVTSGDKFEEDAELTISATANTGYTFTDWTATGLTLSESDKINTDLTITMPANDVTLTANFTANTYTLTTNSAHGTLTVTVDGVEWNGTDEIACNAAVSIAVAAEAGYAFTNWTITGATLADNTVAPAEFAMPAGNVTITANFDEVETRPVNWFVNGTKIGTDNVAVGEDIAFNAPASVPAGFEFMYWSSSEIAGTSATEAGTKVTAQTAETGVDYNYYAVFAEVTGSTPASWAEETLGNLTSSDVFVIVGIKESDMYALGNDHGTSSAPSATAVTISGSNLTSSVTDNIKWSVSGDATNGYTFYPNGSTETWLYCTNNNNGVRVGTNNNKTFKISSGYLKHDGTSRYVGVYNAGTTTPDWRCYTSTSTNIDGQTFKYYKYVAPSNIYANYCTTIPTATITLAAACTDGDKYYATYSNGSAFIVPADLTVSAITSVVGGKLTITNYGEGDIVNANTGVLVSSTTAGEKTVVLTAATGTEISGNMLKASGDGIDAAGMDEANTKFYRLTMHNGTQIGFWWGAAEGAAFDIAANKAYLAVPNGSGAREGLWFNDDVTTGINAVENAENVKAVYNLAGQRVAQPTRGLYIVNGKKIVIK